MRKPPTLKIKRYDDVVCMGWPVLAQCPPNGSCVQFWEPGNSVYFNKEDVPKLIEWLKKYQSWVEKKPRKR